MDFKFVPALEAVRHGKSACPHGKYIAQTFFT